MDNNSLISVCSVQKNLAISRMINIPVELSKKEITENVLKDIVFDNESKITPSSSGKGDAMIMPAITGMRYPLKNLGVLLTK